MSTKIKPNILLDINDELTSSFDNIFKDFECEIFSDELACENFDIIFTQNENFAVEQNQKIIYLSADDIDKDNVLNPESVDHPLITKSIRRFCGESSSIDLEQSLTPVEIKNFKITNRFSVGYYYDHVTLMANNFGLDYDKVGEDYLRTINTLLTVYKSLPISIDIIIGEDYFAFQSHATVSNLKNVKPVSSHSTLVDIYTIKDSSKLVIGMYYLRDIKSTSSLISYELSFNDASSNNIVYETLGNLVDYTKSSEIERKKVKESSLSKIKKIIDFIKASDFNSNLTIEQKIQEFPDKVSVEGLTQEDIDFIKKIVSEDSIYDAITSTILGHKDDLLGSEDFPEKIAQALENMELSEFTNFFSSDEDAFTRIKGVTEDVTEDIVRVGGKIDDDNSFMRVSGSKEDSYNQKNDLWKVKRLEVAAKLKDQLSKLSQSGGVDKESVQERIKNSLVENFNLSDVECGSDISNKLNDSLIESASIDDIGVKITNEKSADAIFLRLENDRIKGQIEKKNDQIVRMKRIIDTMKRDFMAKKEADKVIKNSALTSEEMTGEQKLASVNLQVEMLLKEVKTRDVKMEQSELAHAHTLKNKDHRISLLEDKVSDLITKNVEMNNDDASDGKLNELSHNVKKLENQLSVADARVKMLSKKYDEEIKNKQQLINAQQEFKKLYGEEKTKVESLIQRVKQAEHKSAEVSKAAASDDGSKEKIRDLEANLKESHIETKKFEQKLKFMTSQLQEMDKKLKKVSGSAGGPGGGGAGSGSDTRVKQLEKNVEKITSLKAKAEEDLIKKKEEVHKLKQENMITMNKINDLERKLSKFEKKAA